MRHRSGHIGNAIMDDPVFDIRRITVRGRTCSLDAASLINGHVDDHGAFLHVLHHLASDQLRRRSSRDEHAADKQIRFRCGLGDNVGI